MAVMVATIITTNLIPIMGSLSDRVGRKSLYVYGSIGMILYAFPYFWLIHQGSVVLLMIATIIGSPIAAVLGTMGSEIFSAEVLYTDVSLRYQIGATLARGTAPLVATAFLAKFNYSYVPVALYIIFTAIVSLIAIWAVRDRLGQALDG